MEAGVGPGGMMGDQAAQTMLVRLNRIELQQAEYHRQVETQINNLHHTVTTNFTRVFNNFRRYGETMPGAVARQRGQGAAAPPARNRNGQRGAGGAAVPDGPGAAVLCHNPRTLIELWTEFKHGVNGRKAAEQFTTREKNSRVGGIKQKYYRRKAVWECMQRLVTAGNTPQAAAHRIRQCYGFRMSVTQIINFMLADRRRGGHPNLQ